MVIDLEQYRRARRWRAARTIAADERCEEERMCVNWRPSRSVAALFCYREPHLLSPQLPEDFASVDVDDYLDRLYTLASQV